MGIWSTPDDSTWRFSGESSDSTAVEEIIELTKSIFKSRIISQEGPGKPEGQVLPSEIFTVTRCNDRSSARGTKVLNRPRLRGSAS